MSSLFGIGGGGNVGASGSFYSHSIDQSLRFNDGDSAYLTRDPSSAGDRQKFTYSVWFKRSVLSAAEQDLFSAGDSSTDRFEIILSAAYPDTLSIYMNTGGTIANVRTSQVFRDVSAFYNLVVAFDTTQGTAANRIKIYVNGTQVTSFATETYPSQNFNTAVNSTSNQYISKRNYVDDRYYDGYMAEVNMIDGQQLDSSSFGETKDGIWIPKAYSGSYGTNGFRLTFQGTGTATTSQGTTAQTNIGDDQSGTGNNFAVSGLASSDVVLDSPNTNFATYNPLNVQGPAGAGTYSATNGNLKGTTTSGSTSWVGTTFGLPSGKWYWEARSTGSTSGWPRVGFYSMGAGGDSISSITSETSNNLSSLRLVYNSGCGVEPFGSTSVTQITGSISSGDILQIAIDVDAGKIWYGVNNTYLASGNPATGANAIDDYTATTYNPVMPCVGTYSSQALPDLNFGQDSTFAGATTAGGNTDGNGKGDFKHPVPNGFLALCSFNLPDSTIGPGQTALAEDYFVPYIYTADNTSPKSRTGLGFSADFLWFKDRTTAFSHGLYDTIRGPNKQLQTNNTNPENSYTLLSSFDADGFTTQTDGTAGNVLNYTTDNYVTWAWKAGGTPTATNSAGAGAVPTSGSVLIDGVASTSTLAGTIAANKITANTAAGFSIINYTGNGLSGQTVAHGLSSTPEFLIMKDRGTNSNNGQWQAWHLYAGDGDDYGYLSTSVGFTGDAQIIPNGTDTIELKANLTTTNQSGHSFIMYAFHSVDGFSKVGKWVGNGISDGPMIFTGFRPSFILTKRSDGTSWWGISDSKRSPYNEVANTLAANESYTESVLTSDMNVDFLSNGFKIRDTSAYYNASGGNYIYLAFAETPAKFANAR